MKLVDLKTQALRYLALGEPDQALLCYRAILRQLPHDLDTRMKVADVLVQGGQPDQACRVYAAVAWCDVQAGRPLHALVCCQALADLGQSVSSIHDSLAALYGAGSTRLSRGESSARPGPLPDGETEVAEIDMQPLPAGVTAELSADLAADLETFTVFPSHFSPVPLLSELPPQAFARVCQAALIRRVMPRTAIIKEGSPAYSLFLLASGTVEIQQGDKEGSMRRTLSRLREGAIVGELALLSPRARLFSVEATEPADLLELPVKVLRTAAGELPSVALALDHFLGDRLARSAIRRSSIFTPFTIGQRLDFLPHFQRLDLPPEGVLLHEGQIGGGLYVVLGGNLEVVKGHEPFEKVEGHLFPGEIFGEHFLLHPTPSAATLRSDNAATAIFLPREDFERLCHAVPAVSRYFDELGPERLRELVRAPGQALGRGPGSEPRIDPRDEEDAEFPFLV